jgi:hypothetical protein
MSKRADWKGFTIRLSSAERRALDLLVVYLQKSSPVSVTRTGALRWLVVQGIERHRHSGVSP